MIASWEVWAGAVALAAGFALIAIASVVAFRSWRAASRPPYSAPIHDPRD